MMSPTILQTGHLPRRDDSQAASFRNAIRFVEVDSMDPIVPRSGRVKAATTMASTTIEETARRQNHSFQLYYIIFILCFK